jgi:hypothetical protein
MLPSRSRIVNALSEARLETAFEGIDPAGRIMITDDPFCPDDGVLGKNIAILWGAVVPESRGEPPAQKPHSTARRKCLILLLNFA